MANESLLREKNKTDTSISIYSRKFIMQERQKICWPMHIYAYKKVQKDDTIINIIPFFNTFNQK